MTSIDVSMSASPPGRGLSVSLLDLGALAADEGFFFRGANAGTAGTPNPASHSWRELQLISAVIEHPDAGLLLYDVGIPPGPEGWDTSPEALFPLRRREAGHELPEALAVAGHGLSDVSGVIISHLHADHAGGLLHFVGTDVPVYVHRRELEHAFFAVATGEDPGSYGAAYLSFDVNWQPLDDDEVNLFRGIDLVRLPGHTPGLLGMSVERPDGPPLFFVNDQFPFPEHREAGGQGWVGRDDRAWHASRRKVERIAANTGAELVFGHDPVAFERVAGYAPSARRNGIGP